MQITQEESELLKELVRELNYPEFDPQKHVTSKMLANELGLTRRAAFDRLERLHRKGKLKREKVKIPGGKWAWGYYRE